MEDSFRRHVDSLLKISAIRPSKSRHRTMAMIVNLGTTIDPVTGKKVKGKERMVFNYKSLNDNTYKDQYSLLVSTMDFLGAVIGEGTIKLQPHIIKKIVNFNEEELKTKKRLRSFLGMLNYARTHIPKPGILLRPLYEKTNAHGDKRMKPSDYDLVRKIKEQVQNLPDLEIPPENAYTILETDGCMEGWGGVVKWKKSKEDPRNLERICAYASGKFSTTQSIINAEINACINTLEKLKITLRTDCQAIISFYNKTNSNKSSRVRWIKFADAIIGTRVKINIEHIEGKHNTLADSLSRLVNLCFAECTGEIKELAAVALYSMEEVLQDWDATTSNFPEDDASNDDNNYRYNRKGFLEDDDACRDDSIFIVDPGWDDYCLQMIRDQAKEYYEKKAVMQKQEELWQSKESLLIRDLTDALKTIDQLRIEKERLEEQKDEEIKKLKAQLQKRKEE
nr:ORFIII-like polyprotein [Tanacetum cinerariifolium]